MFVGLAADCCAVGGESVDGELLISFLWRFFRMTLHVARVASCDLVPSACFFFFCLIIVVVWPHVPHLGRTL